MSQVYQMNSSFDDGATWYQLRWLDVEFRDFEGVGKECNSIEELNSKILEAFPNCHLEYEYLGERKNRKSAAPPKETKKTRKKK